MIAFGVSVAEGDAYRRYSEPGIKLAKEPDSEVYVFAAVGPPARAYNLLLDTAAGHEDLEAFALVHPHAEITDGAFCDKIRRAMSDADVAVVGAIGATGIRSIAWWQGEISSGDVRHAYLEFGGGAVPAFSWKAHAPAPQDVDCVDEFLMVLSPWAVRNLRFDESLALGHGHDVDFCLQARAAGRKVVTAELGLVQHRSIELIEDDVVWSEAHIHVAEKWQGRMPGDDAGLEHPTDQEWKRRARRAEAEREAAQAIAYSNGLSADAVIQPLERELARTTGTLSWRITEPLRRINHWRRERTSANGAGPAV